MMNQIKTKYGFEVGKIYKTCMPVTDEYGNSFDTGTLVRLIAIVPKGPYRSRICGCGPQEIFLQRRPCK